MASNACRYCGSEISARAVMCPVCKLYQSRWRNNLLFLAGLVGFFGLLASAATFVLDRSLGMWNSFFGGDRIRVLSFHARAASPEYRIVVTSLGPWPVFLYDVTVHWHGGSRSYDVSRMIEKNAIAVIDRETPEAVVGVGDLLGTRDGKLNEIILRYSSFPINQYTDHVCFFPAIYNDENHRIARMKAHYLSTGMQLVTASVRAYTSFYSPQAGKTIQQDFPAITLFAMSNSPHCKDLSVK